MRTELVTVFGGSGFIGRHVVRLLAEKGARVRVAVRHPNNALFLKPMGEVGQIQLIAANLTHEESVHRAVEGADAAINLVGILAEGGHQSFEGLHAQGAETVARVCAEAEIGRLIQVSAIGASRRSQSKYARTKAKGEEAVKEAQPNATILRPSIVFGPEDEFFNRFAAMARISPFLPLIGGGHTRFQPVYVEDVAQAAVNALQKPAAQGEIFELGGPRVYTFREILEFILKVTHRRRIFLPMPFFAAKFLGAMIGWLPGAPITLDQVRQLENDNVVAENARTLADLDVEPDAVEAIVPSYLGRFRKLGQFEKDEWDWQS